MIIDSFSEIYLEKDLDYLPMTISFFLCVWKKYISKYYFCAKNQNPSHARAIARLSIKRSKAPSDK